MDRRNFIGASAASLAAGAAGAAEDGSNQYYEIREYQLRNSKTGQTKRLREFLESEHLPMTRRAGYAAVGYFNQYLGEDGPRYFVVNAFESLAHMEEAADAAAGDEKWQKALKEFGQGDPAFDFVESRLLRAFDGMKTIEVPETSDDRPERFFDLRTYRAETFADLSEKIKMFNTEEIEIFRKTGINPVLFGETIIGRRMPNLTYLVWYDDMAGRDKAWRGFLSDPDWIRIRSKPGWGNDDIVSTVSNTHLRPLPFSPIR